MKILPILLLFLIFIISVNIASADYIVASDYTRYVNSTEKSTTSATYTHLLYIDNIFVPGNHTIQTARTGVARFSWDMHGGNNPVTYALVYKNGVPFGSELSTISVSYEHVYFDATVDLVVGDTYELRGKRGDGHTIYVKNFNISYDVVTNGVYGIAYTLVNGVETPIEGAEVRMWLANGTGNSNSTITTTGGSYSFNGIEAGTYYLQSLKGDEYDPSATEIITVGASEFKEKDILMAGCTQAYNCFANKINPLFHTIYSNGSVAEGVTALVTKYGEGSAYKTDTTGTDGDISFQLLKTQRYNISFDINGFSYNWTGYPREQTYVIEMNPTNQSYNYTAPTQTYNNTTTGGGIASYFNSTNLTTTQGIDPTGQGLIMSITIWFLLGVGSGIASIFLAITAMLGFVWLGLISMGMVVLFILVSLSLMAIWGQI